LAHASSEALIEVHFRLYRQIERINRKWFDRLAETRDSEIAPGNGLLQCRDPTQAATLCRKWVLRRGAILAGAMQSFRQLWLDFCAEMPTPLDALRTRGGQASESN
jgi:hypothetical protein